MGKWRGAISNKGEKMEDFICEKLTLDNFTSRSLNNFQRYQQVVKSHVKIDGVDVIIDDPYVEDWDLEQRQNVALEVLSAIENSAIVYGAFYDGEVVGFIYMEGFLFGEKEYIHMKKLHISFPYRGCGLGRELFFLATRDAKKTEAKKVYISANSSTDSQRFYRKIDCVDAQRVDDQIQKDNPYDLQMEYIL